MRLSSLCLATARFALAVAVILLFSPATFAQHSSSGASSSSSSSSSSGGGSGSHGGSSGGSAAAFSSSGSSGGGHSSGVTTSGRSSSGASSSHGSSSLLHGSSEHSSSAPPASLRFSGSNPTSVHSVREPSGSVRGKTEAPEKRSFFSFLRHPFKKPEPKPAPSAVANLRRPICFHGPCQVCPGGQARAGGVCGGTVAANNARTFCELGQSWNGTACAQTRFPEDCRALLVSLQQQQERMREADAAQRGACAAGPSQECSDVTSSAQNEAGAYRSLQDRYRMCQQQSFSLNPFGRLGGLSYSRGLMFDPFEFELDVR